MLEKPVRFDFRPVTLSDSEVKVGDTIVMVGYGPGESSSKHYGSRQFGENRVTRVVNLETGSVVFGAAVPPGPDYAAPAHAGPGDSGGACVRSDNPNILVGIITMGAQTAAGIKMSLFTSICPHKQWLSQIVRRINGE